MSECKHNFIPISENAKSCCLCGYILEDINKCYICKDCKSHNWHPSNARECCEDLSQEEIEKKIFYWENKKCGHCNKIIGVEQ